MASTDKCDTQVQFETEKMSEMTKSVSEIKKTNGFILKRLTQQQEQLDNGNLHIGNMTDALMKRLEDLEKREREQDEEMKLLVNTVTEIGNKISLVCANIDTLKEALGTNKGAKVRRRKHKRHGDIERQETIESEKDIQVSEQLTKKKTMEDSCDSKENMATSVGENSQLLHQSSVEDSCDIEKHISKETQEDLSHHPSLNGREKDCSQSEHPLQKEEGEDLHQPQQLPARHTGEDSSLLDQPQETGTEEHSQNRSQNAIKEIEVDYIQKSDPVGINSARDTDTSNENSDKMGNLNLISSPDQPNIVSPLCEFPNIVMDPARATIHSLSINNENQMTVDEEETPYVDVSVVSDEMWQAMLDLETERGKKSKLPRGDGIDTVFLIDISESISSAGLHQTKEAVSEILDWMEMEAKDENLEENVSVVTFGHLTQCRHFPTKDYQSVRDCVDALKMGGSSPLCGGLQIALAVFKHEEEATTLVHGHKVSPRIVLFSDGKATDHHYLNGPENTSASIEPKVKESIHNLASELAERKICLQCVPVGDADQELITDVAQTSGGQVVTLEDVSRIGRHFKNLVSVLEIKKQFPSGQLDRKVLKTVINMSKKSTTDNDLDDMMVILSSPAFQQKVDIGNDFDDLVESNPQMPPIGTRVRRGPDWKWKSQDQDGVGTVIGHGRKNWIKVEWDNSNKRQYRYGADGAYDVVVVEEPRLLKPDEMIGTGCVVCRGGDWTHGDQDGGFGQIGVVYNMESNGQVWVRWPNGGRFKYNFGIDGRFDLEVCDPFEVRHLQAEQEAAGAGAASLLLSRRSSTSSDLSIPMVPEPMGAESPDEDENLMSIYDMAPPPRNSQSKEMIEAMQMSLVEAMNKKNECPQSLPPIRKQSSDTDSSEPSEKRTGSPDPTLSLSNPIISQNAHSLPAEILSVKNQENSGEILTPSSVKDVGIDLVRPEVESNQEELVDVQIELQQTMMSTPDPEQNSTLTALSSSSQSSNTLTKGADSEERYTVTGSEHGDSTGRCESPDLPVAGLDVTGDPDKSELQQSVSENLVKPLLHSTPVLGSMTAPCTKVQNTTPSTTKHDHNARPPDHQPHSQQTTGEMESSILQGGVQQSSMTSGSVRLMETSPDSSSSSIRNESQNLPDTGEVKSQVLNLPSVQIPSKTLGASHADDSCSDTFSDTASSMSDMSMIVQTDTVWQWEDNFGVWHSYSTDINLKIEKARKRGPKSTAVVQLNGQYYRVVMYKGIQIHTKDRTTNKIRRIDKSEDVANIADMET